MGFRLFIAALRHQNDSTRLGSFDVLKSLAFEAQDEMPQPRLLSLVYLGCQATHICYGNKIRYLLLMR